MTRYDTTSIHRYLDGVFEGIPLTPEVQDLKEELRGNLSARVAELEASGLEAAAASRKAVKELGDVKEIIAQLGEGKAPAPTPRANVAAAYNRNRVRPKPAFVVRTVVLSLLIAAGAVLFVLALIGGDSGITPSPWLGVTALALPIGLLVADSLHQETTSSHPLPGWRATGYGASIALMVAGVGFAGQFIARSSQDWMLMVGICLAVAGIVLVSYLGATQTNRMKSWAKEVEGDWPDPIQARIECNPAVGARFGIYSGVLWIAAIGAFVGVSMQFGFKWSWTIFVGAILVQMILLARTVLADDKRRA